MNAEHVIENSSGGEDSRNIYQLIPRIAVVEPDAEALVRLTSSLESQSYEVKGFRTGQDFLQFALGETVVDLALIDVHLSDMSGWNLVRHLRSPAFSCLANLPIILKSTVLSPELAIPVTLRMGGDAFLEAPFTSSELAEVIATLLKGQPFRLQRKHLLVSGSRHDHLRASLRRTGHKVTEVCDIAAARLRLRTYRPDVVLVDHGFADAFSEVDIRESSATFLLLEEFSSHETQSHWLSKGYSGILSDFDPNLLLSLIEDFHRADCLSGAPSKAAAGEQKFEAGKETFQLLFDGIPDPALIFGPRGEILDVNENCQRSFACQREHLLGRLVSDFLEGYQVDSRLFEQASLEELEQEESAQSVCTRFNGTTFQAEIVTCPLLFRGRRAVIAFIRDTTAEASAREAVRISEAKLRIIAENTHDWEFWRSPQGHFLYSSPACVKICGYQPREFEMMPDFLRSITLPSDYSSLPENEETARPDEAMETEFRLVSRAGEIRWVRYSSHPVYDDHNNLLGRRGSIRDVTEQRKVARERETLGAAVEQSSEAIGVSDLEGTILYANPAFKELFEWSNQCRERKPLSKRRWKKVSKQLARGERWNGTLKRRRKNGSVGHLEFSLSPLRMEDDHIHQVTWLIRDVTAETEIRERLETAQRMDSLGNLAGGLAHDFNNLLAGILGHASLLASVSGSEGEVFEAAEVITTAARRASDLTQKLLGFARRGKQKHEAFSLHSALAETEALLGRNLPKGAAIDKDLEAENPWIEGDPSQFSQVLINLTINATQAITAETGRISFRTRNSVCPETGRTLVCLTISDNGCGMSRATVQRIFEPFFTTKEQGSGLGLAMVYGIVTNHGGKLEVSSELGEGTEFSLTFPVTEDRPAGEGTEQEEEPGQDQRGGRILVIDDEKMVRLTLEKLLTRLGYEVVTCAGAREGIDHYTGHRHEVGLVILDMLMPGMDGLECFQRLKEIDEGVRVILSSGYCHDDMAKQAIAQGILAVLPKPFDFRQVSSTIQQHLSVSSGG